jgi:tRNA A37 threonylcarbamoyladenosine biosynthesis protein TsaE
MVLGAEKAFKKLTCCMAVQNVKQSAGLHPKLNGESGSGKTWVVLTFAHHLPPEAVVKGSSSNLAAFYHQDGDQVFRILDDYQAGNETLDTIIKQTSSVFHQEYDHRTVKKQEPLTLHIGSEQTWAVTSVDGSQDIQVLNRQIPINVDDSEELTRKVNSRTIARYGKGEEQFPEDEAVLVCRQIWRILRADGLIDVKIPFFERIDWLDTSNRRNPSIFMDLLIAHTAINRYQRTKDSEGFYLATEADFQAAKALFTDKDAEELVHRLTRKEREFTDLLCEHLDGLTREQAATALHISVNRVSQLAYGEKGKGGLTQKLPGFTAEDITDSEILDAGECKRRSTKRTLFKLTRYDHLTGFEVVVRLLPETGNGEDRKYRKDNVRSSVRIDECKENSNGEREIREREIECKECKENVREASGKAKSENFSLSLKNPEKSLHQEESATRGAKSILTDTANNPYGHYTKPPDSEKKSLHPKCEVCGADLEGKGRIEKGDKVYCAKPGCGYPKRGEEART